MAGQPITAAPWVELTYGLGSAVGAGVSLLDNGTDPLDPAARWRASQGFTLEGAPCEYHNYRDDICLPTVGDPDDFPGLHDYEDGYPFILSGGVRCSTVAAPDLAEFHALADRQLELTQWRQIAHELMTGEQNTLTSHTNRSLQTDSTALTAATSQTMGISKLEAAFASWIAGPHLIHVPPAAMTYLKAANLITGQGGRWYTALGSLVIADNGYEGNSPADAPAAAGKAYFYGSGPITVRLDRTPFHPEPELANAVTYQTNDYIVRSQKLAGVSYLCESFSILVDLVA